MYDMADLHLEKLWGAWRQSGKVLTDLLEHSGIGDSILELLEVFPARSSSWLCFLPVHVSLSCALPSLIGTSSSSGGAAGQVAQGCGT